MSDIQPGPVFGGQVRSRVKDLSLTRYADYLTGLSFWDYIHSVPFIKFSISRLQAAGYVVRPDGGLPATKLWSGEVYIEPNIGAPLPLPAGHVTVYFPDQEYWDSWYQADLANKNTERKSPQLLAFSALREP